MSDPSTHILITNPRFQDTIERHRAFWQRSDNGSTLRSAGLFAPSVPIYLPQPDGSQITHAEPLTPDMVDPASFIAEVEASDDEMLLGNLSAEGQYLVTNGLGDLVPNSRPFCKIPWMEAMLGCPLKMTEGHIWNEHYVGDPEEVIRRGVRLDGNPWYELYLEFIRQLQDRIGHRFPASANTLLRGTSDLAAAIMGVEEACIAWIDQPAFMERLMRTCTDALLQVIEAGYGVLKPVNDGFVSGWSLWAPAPIVWTQADHSTLLSAKMYARQILPFDLEVIRSCPISVVHLHNCGLHIAPLLVEIPELTAIEVIMDPYPQGERKTEEVQLLQLIQQHKPLILDANFPSLEESEWLLSQLSPRGLCFNPRYDEETFTSIPRDYVGSDTWILNR